MNLSKRWTKGLARKYSLKDNPIFQGLQVPKPPAESLPDSEDLETPAEALPESQNLTLKSRPSNLDPQNLTPSKKQTEALAQSTFEVLQEREMEAEAEPDTPSLLLKDAVTFDLRDNIDRTLFFGFYNEVADALLPTLDVSCQVLYNRLFRLSYGFNRNYCTVSQPILMEKTGLSRNTVRTGLQSLTKAGWLRIVESGNRISTTYRIVLPREQSEHTTIRLSNSDPQTLTLKSRPSKSEAQNQRLKIRGSKIDGQNLPLQRVKFQRAKN
jgi:hypothetical protein